jgi:hypothetical protein
VEADLVKALQGAEKSATRWDKKIRDLRTKLAQSCTHPLTTRYMWEHDNGYGKQKMIEGLKCLLCKAEKPWSMSTLWNKRP